MADSIIKVENLSKRFIISHEERESYTSLRDVITRKVKRTFSFGEKKTVAPPSTEEFWALKDLDFEIKQGDCVGIIGRNGAGKSTLLKILSRITEPTSGRVTINGRVASLLEVGTGFHPELTGRENIYLNGAILGMSRAEIRRKFDEIVAFAEVERFLDTPVKRYSSGMYVRLAFAVAAHLEPEILIVDEVLAVGDAQFQKKCLGKMEDVSKNEGRTVLFVSHNIAVVKSLCTSAILLKNGLVQSSGDMEEVIKHYLLTDSIETKISNELGKISNRTGNGEIKFSRFCFLNRDYQPISCPVSGSKLTIRLFFSSKENRVYKNCRIGIAFRNYDSVSIVLSTEMVLNEPVDIRQGTYLDFEIEKFPLSKGEYILTLFLESNSTIEDWLQDVFKFSVEDGDFYGTSKSYPAGYNGKTVLIDFKVSSKHND
jgi:lipopolysaccharide transport system ATP-binding protein